MEKHYCSEKNIQILIALLKAHGIRKVIASPGTTNCSFIGSIQTDSFFEIYSSADERSAAYIACGLAAESGEAVALSCTGATASRNYVPGLTEAYYRNLPVLAITSTQYIGNIGHLVPQVIDRTAIMNDIAKTSVQIPTPRCGDEEWFCEISINKALLELKRSGGGPVHINIETTYSQDYSARMLPKVRAIGRIHFNEKFPVLSSNKTAIYVGAHVKWNNQLIKVVDEFCEKYNGVVVCEHVSNYKGKYGVCPSLLANQIHYSSPNRNVDVMIHIGGVTAFGAYMNAKEIWRVHPDGEIRDTFKKLKYVFEMEEIDFFTKMLSSLEKTSNTSPGCQYYKEYKEECDKLLKKIPELPFSNAWIAQNTVNKLPKESVLQLGILNSVRSWNFFEIDNSICAYSNTGGFGIDGLVSTLLGASLAHSQRLYFGIVGDLAFFYDMNAIGNRHIGNNIRLLLVNNGKGTEFKNFNHPVAKFGEDADKYMAAAGHYGNQSRNLVKHYAKDLGFEYLQASDKENYFECVARFTTPEITERPMIFEVFTDSEKESQALEMLYNIEFSTKGALKKVLREALGEQGVKMAKKVLGK